MSKLTAREIATTVEGVTALCLGDSKRLVWVQATDAAAFNDGERMYLPRPTGQHEGEHALLLSLALKEVAKIKLSEVDAFMGVAPSHMPLAAVLEEARLNCALGNEYRGSPAIFDDGNVIAASLLLQQEDIPAAQAATLAVWASAHHGFLASTSSEDVANKMRALGHAHVDPTRLDTALRLAAGASSCASTAEVVALAQQVASALAEPPQQDDPPPQGQEQQQSSEPESPAGDEASDSAHEAQCRPKVSRRTSRRRRPRTRTRKRSKGQKGEDAADSEANDQDESTPDGQDASEVNEPPQGAQEGDGVPESSPERAQPQDGAGEGGEDDANDAEERVAGAEGSYSPQGGDDSGQQQNNSTGGSDAGTPDDHRDGDGQNPEAGDAKDVASPQGGAAGADEQAGGGNPSSAGAEPAQELASDKGQGEQPDANAVADPLSQALARARGHDRASDVSADAQVLQQQGVEQMPTDEALALVEAALADMDPLERFNEAAVALAAVAPEDPSQDEADAVASAMSGGDGYATGQHQAQDYRLEGVEARLLTVLLRDLQDRRRRPSRMGYGGRVAANQVWRLSALGDTKVFRKRAPVTGVDAAVSVLLDTSSSMAPIIETAVESTFALAQALHRIQGVQVSVDHFPGIDQPSTELLGFRESVRLAEPRFRSLGAEGGTPTGRALAVRLPSLLAVRAERRMVVVVTDGQPNPDEGPMLAATMETLRRNDVKVIGIGIQADVTHLFEHSVLIEGVSELPTALEALFKDMVVRLVA